MKARLLSALGAALWFFTVSAYAGQVGFSKLTVPDGANPPLQVGVWYPTDAPARPTQIGLFTQAVAVDAPIRGAALKLVAISHGHGGEFAGHSDTAYALAASGFVAASLTHTGDNYRDESRGLDMAGRTRSLHAVIDAMMTHWPRGTLDPDHVGLFGFSAGGFTVLAEAGGTPDMRRIGPHCVAHPDFFDCALTAGHRPGNHDAAATYTHDARIRAVVAAAPALGFTCTAAGLRDVTMPVQLWRAGNDKVLPSPFYVEPVAAALPHPPDLHVVPGAGHFDVLAPCPAALAKVAPAICISAPGFDRAAFHDAFNRAVVAFFTRALAPGN
ncbi:MAG TPA: hypothetical protein VMB71_12035 [Acetobacteraceae bacterium]|nr:hypothetical protein [Acetobacteraceae bacterium]